MPVIQVNLIRGYSSGVKQRLCRRLTDATRGVLDAAPEAITVFLHEVEMDGYARGGRARAPAIASEETPEERVRAFLTALEARDLDAAERQISDDFVMVFPGSPEMTRLSDLIAWAGDRYRFVRKTFQTFDTCDHEDHSVVICHGHLSGEWPDGTPFEAIRFIDRFEVRDNRLARQDVWNDLALARS
ncbi:tautomerase family protein [Algihabitans albus]|uniref:tautomerase family protein n=1 Tax=Algihabitans albus TaxID=2164067 RepID=UPI000E5D9028|nr:tautomerase family protein [Algihabitans albus]